MDKDLLKNWDDTWGSIRWYDVDLFEKVDKLIQDGADVNLPHPDSGKGELLRTAVYYGCSAVTRRLIEAGVDVNAQGKNGKTGLMVAACQRHETIASELVSAGADVNLQDQYGWTALMYAASNGYDPIVNSLIANGAKTDIKNREGYTAGQLALFSFKTRLADKLKVIEQDQIANGDNQPVKPVSELNNSMSHIDKVSTNRRIPLILNQKNQSR